MKNFSSTGRQPLWRALCLLAVLALVTAVRAATYNVTLQPGFNLVGIHLLQSPNTIDQVLTVPPLPDNTTAWQWKYNNGTFAPPEIVDFGSWDPGTATLPEGTGVFVRNPNSTPLTITLSGASGSGPTIAYDPASGAYNGYYMLANAYPGAETTPATYSQIVGHPEPANRVMQLFRWDALLQQYKLYEWFPSSGWSPGPPTVPVGEAVFLNAIPVLPTTAPCLVSFEMLCDAGGNYFLLRFDQEVSQASALAAGSYSFVPPVSVGSIQYNTAAASSLPDTRVVKIYISGQPALGLVTVNASGVQNLAGLAVSGGCQSAQMQMALVPISSRTTCNTVSSNSVNDSIIIKFNGPLDPFTAQFIGSYSVNAGAISVVNATLNVQRDEVTLELGSALPAGNTILNVDLNGLFGDCGRSLAAATVTVPVTSSCGELITGKVFYDVAGNCVFDGSDYPLSLFQVRVVSGSSFTSFAPCLADGTYKVRVPVGTYTVTLVPVTSWVTAGACPSSYSVNVTAGVTATADFAMQYTGAPKQDLSASMYYRYLTPPGGTRPFSSPCCGYPMTLVIEYRNNGTVPMYNADLQVNIPALAQPLTSGYNLADYCYEQALPAIGASTLLGSSLLDFTIPSLMPGQHGRIEVTIKLNCPLGGSETVSASADILPTAGDFTPADNHSARSDTTRCAFDPNDKTVSPKGCGPQGFVPVGTEFTYLVQFQNIGSGPAQRVVIRDRLDTDLSLTTVQLIGASHPYTFVINTSTREMVWTFDDINLPGASYNEPGSHGYVRYKVKHLVGRPVGTVITNQAAIYFDLNPPIYTAITTNTLSSSTLPNAFFTASPAAVLTGQPVNFTYTNSNVGVTFFWNFGSDAIPSTSTAQNPGPVVYLRPGVKLPTLVVSQGGCGSEPYVGRVDVRAQETCEFSFGDEWRYLQTDADPGAAWPQSAYNDAGWPTGRGVFDAKRSGDPKPSFCRNAVAGYPVNTCLSLLNSTASAQLPAYYFRRHFQFTGNPANAVLKLTGLIDDGAVFRLNGQEIGRVRMPAGAVSYNTPASSTVGTAMVETFLLAAGSALQVGDNVIAVEVHQASLTSSDVTFGLALCVLNEPGSGAQAPSVLLQPASQSVPEGNSAQLEVSAAGTSPLSYEWFGPAGQILGARSNILAFPEVRQADAGSYTVRVSNSAGSVTSQVARMIMPLSNLRPGFNTSTLAGNDDGSTGYVSLGQFEICFGGQFYAGLYVNNNGNVTFNNPMGTYTPSPLNTIGQPILAPFFADVDTRPAASGKVTYGSGFVGLNPAFAVTWKNVGYYNQQTDKLNSFQLVIISLGSGNFDIEYRYDRIQWETGSASGGINGYGGSSARMGYYAGASDYWEVPGSGVTQKLVDSNITNPGLRHGSQNSGQAGVYRFSVRDCHTPPPCAEPIVLHCPTNLTNCVCAPNTSAAVPYTVTATSPCPNAVVTINCTPPSPGPFPIGTTTVYCSATDNYGNYATCSFKVTIARDVMPPVIHCPGNITRYICGSQVRVYYKPWATDNCSSVVNVQCFPPSGSSFNVGTSSVLCTATDACGNVSQCAFTVKVVDKSIWQTILAGNPDCFSWPYEGVVRSTCLGNAYQNASWKLFDDQTPNRFFGYSWLNLPNGIIDASLGTSLVPKCWGGSTNDTIHLGLAGCGSTPNWQWSRAIGSGNIPTGLLNQPWCNQTLCGVPFGFNLKSMPFTGVNLLPAMNATHRLDMMVQDDTAVDYAWLRVRYCLPTHIANGVSLSLTNAILAYTWNGWCLARNPELVTTSYTANFNLGLSTGVRLGVDTSSLSQSTNGRVSFLRQATMEDAVVHAFGVELLATNGVNGASLRWQPVSTNPTNAWSVILRQQGTVVLSATLPAFAPHLDLPASASVTEVRFSSGTRCTLQLAAPVLVTSASGTVLADEIELQLMDDPQWIRGFCPYSLQVTASNLEEVGLHEVALEVNGRFQTATGDVLATSDGSQLVLSPLDENSVEPVSATLTTAPTNEFRAPLGSPFGVIAPVSSNASLTLITRGIVGGIERDLPALRFANNGAGWSLTALRNGAPLPLNRVQVWNSGVMIANVVAPSSVQMASLPIAGWPSITWFVDDDICHRLPLGSPIAVQVNGVSYQATELRVLIDSYGQPVQALTGMRVEVVQADLLALPGLESGAEKYHLETPVIDPDGITIHWNGMGSVLQSAPSLNGPWTTVAGTQHGEVTLPRDNAPARFFRVFAP